MCELLIGKEKTRWVDPDNQRGSPIGYPCFDKKDVVSAIKFYKKYHNDYEQFLKDFPNTEKKSHYLWLNHHNFDNDSEHYNEFNCWLFDYTFKDVI